MKCERKEMGNISCKKNGITYKILKKERIRYYISSYLIVFFLCLLFYHSFLLGFLVSFISFRGLHVYENYLIEKKKAMVIKEFKDLLYSMSTSFASYKSLTEALKEGLISLNALYKDKSLLSVEVREMIRSIEDSNESEERVLIDFGIRNDIEDIRNFVDVYISTRSIGGNINKVINNCSEIIMDKITIEREIVSIMAQKRFESKIIISMPILTVLFLNIFSPTYLENLYTTLLGKIIMTIALAGIFTAFLLIERLTRIEI